MHQWAAEDTEIGAVPGRELTCQRRQSDRFLRLCEPPASPAVRTPGLYDCPLPRQKSSVCSYRWREANASKRTAWAGSALFPSSGLQLHPRSPPDKCVMAPRWLAGPPRPAPCDGSCCSAAWPMQGRGLGHWAAVPPAARSSPRESSAFSLQCRRHTALCELHCPFMVEK